MFSRTGTSMLLWITYVTILAKAWMPIWQPSNRKLLYLRQDMNTIPMATNRCFRGPYLLALLYEVNMRWIVCDSLASASLKKRSLYNCLAITCTYLFTCWLNTSNTCDELQGLCYIRTIIDVEQSLRDILSVSGWENMLLKGEDMIGKHRRASTQIETRKLKKTSVRSIENRT